MSSEHTSGDRRPRKLDETMNELLDHLENKAQPSGLEAERSLVEVLEIQLRELEAGNAPAEERTFVAGRLEAARREERGLQP